jgi:O-antigen/teichoic acid export membrane protein
MNPANKALVRKAVISIFTQSLLSVSSMILGIVVARYSDKSEYGLFVVLFTSIGIACSFQTALATTPLIVLRANRSESEEHVFITNLAIIQVLIMLLLLFVALLAWGIISGILRQQLPISALAFLVLAMIACLCKEYIRSIHYLHLDVKNIFWMDLAFLLILASATFIFVVLYRINSVIAFIILLAAYIGSMLTGFLHLETRFIYLRQTLKKTFDEVVAYSKWAVLGVVASAIQTRAYIYLVSSMLGLEQLADIFVARQLMMPIGMLVTSIKQMTLAKGADYLRHSDHRGLSRLSTLFVLFLVMSTLAYSLLLILAYDKVIELFGSKYHGVRGYLNAWIPYFLCLAVSSTMKYSLIVYKDFKVLTMFEILAAVVTLIAVYLLTRVIGNSGSILAMTIGESVIIPLSIFRKRRLESMSEIREKAIPHP